MAVLGEQIISAQKREYRRSLDRQTHLQRLSGREEVTLYFPCIITFYTNHLEFKLLSLKAFYWTQTLNCLPYRKKRSDWWPVYEKDWAALSSCSPPLPRSLLYQCHLYYHHSSPLQSLWEFISRLLFINLYGFCLRQAQGTYLQPFDAIRKGKRQSW